MSVTEVAFPRPCPPPSPSCGSSFFSWSCSSGQKSKDHKEMFSVSKLLLPETFQQLLSCLNLPVSPPFAPPLTCLHPHPHPSSPCICCAHGLPPCICCHFSVGGVLIFFFFVVVWFCIVSLSPVSRQWFYPMVGDIMLFYHRVEPRTGCRRVSASVRPCVSPYPPPINPKAAGATAGGGGLGSAWFWCCGRWWWCCC